MRSTDTQTDRMAADEQKAGNRRIGQKTSLRKGIFSALERTLGVERYFQGGFPLKHVPKAFFALLLVLLYIGNAHYAEESLRTINRLQIEVEDLRADYITLKADLMVAAKQSEVARRVGPLGLEESLTPPYKVAVDDAVH